MDNPEAIESLCATVSAYRKAIKNVDTSVSVPHVTTIVEPDKIAALDHAIMMLERCEKLPKLWNRACAEYGPTPEMARNIVRYIDTGEEF